MGENFVWGKSVGLFLIKILEIIKLAGSSLGFLWLPPWPEMAVAELSRAGQAVWPTCQPAPGFSGLLHRGQEGWCQRGAEAEVGSPPRRGHHRDKVASQLSPKGG